MFLRYFKNG